MIYISDNQIFTPPHPYLEFQFWAGNCLHYREATYEGDAGYMLVPPFVRLQQHIQRQISIQNIFRAGIDGFQCWWRKNFNQRNP